MSWPFPTYELPGQSSCTTCTHALPGLRCTAFPQGIPDEILDGENLHTKPFKGDNGIRYERKRSEG